MKETITLDGIIYSYTFPLADYRVYKAYNGDRLLVDESGHITHRDNPKADNVVASWASTLKADIRKYSALLSPYVNDIIAWNDEKKYSQGL